MIVRHASLGLRYRAVLAPIRTLDAPVEFWPPAECSSWVNRPFQPLAHRSYSDASGPTSTKPTKPSKSPKRIKWEPSKHAQDFAEAIKSLSPPPIPPRNRRRTSKEVDSEPDATPTLMDIKRVARSPRIKDRLMAYEYRRQLYNEAFARVDKAFTVPQLRALETECLRAEGKTEGVWRYTKALIVQRVLQRQGWYTPVDVKPTVDENITRVYDLPANELFLFLRDTRSILNLIKNKGITFHPVDDSETPGKRVLQASGTTSSLDHLDRLIAGRAKNMTKLTIPADVMWSFTPSDGLLHFVSVVTGAYLDKVGDSEYRVSSMNPALAELGRRLLQVAALRSHALPQTRSLIAVEPSIDSQSEPKNDLSSPAQVALLPFFSTPSSLIPWDTLKTSFSNVLFRLKRASRWASASQPPDSAHQDLASGKVHAVSHPPGQDVSPAQTLMDLLAEMRPSGPSEKTSYLATFGHLVFPAPEDVTTSRPSSLENIVASLSASTQRLIFAPSLTPLMSQSTLTSTPLKSHRLRYRSEDGAASITFTYTYPPEPKFQEVEQQQPLQPQKREEETENWLKKIDEMVAQMKKEDAERKTDAPAAPHSTTSESQDHQKQGTALSEPQDVGRMGPESTTQDTASPSLESRLAAWRTLGKEVDIMIPDRPIDARFTVRVDTVLESDDIPSEIRGIFEAIHATADSETSTSSDSEVGEENASNSDPPDAKSSQSSVPLTPPQLELALDGDDSPQTLFLEIDEAVEISELPITGTLILRAVRSVDQTVPAKRIVSYSELESVGDDLTSDFWSQLDSITRKVPPKTSAGL